MVPGMFHVSIELNPIWKKIPKMENSVHVMYMLCYCATNLVLWFFSGLSALFFPSGAMAFLY